MPPLFKIANPIRFDKLTNLMRIRGVDTYVHWSVFVVAAFILAGVLRHPGLTLMGLMAYVAVLMIHEFGHLVAAQRKGCAVSSIELYRLFGITRFATPWSRLDHCVIAWGGVLAQAVVAIPLVMWVGVFGYTRLEAINMLIAILGFFSLGVAAFNLLPIPPLDGATAWGLLPALVRQRRLRSPSRR
jgi:Zn-dependent protease